MKAVVKKTPGPGGLELLDWKEPDPEPDQVKMRVTGAGICGTDIHIIKGNWMSRPPVVLGHEWCGEIVEAGAQVRHLKPGDRVTASNPARTCGYCTYCTSGNPFMCPDRISAGYMIDGAFAEYMCIDARRCHKIEDHVTFREAALGEPLAVAVRAVTERTTVHAGDIVVVSGPGCIGLLTMQVARLEGARVIVAGLAKDAARLECARKLGADHVLNVDEQPLDAFVKELTGGRGADLVYECAGSRHSLASCWTAVRKQGTLVPLGVHPGPFETDFNNIMMKELNVTGSYGYVWTSWERTVRLLAEHKIDIESLISHELPLDRYEDAFRWTQDGSAIKVIFNPALA
ncbi:MAG: zinc-binding dehydrogenase [Bryobacteraceae bacterium]